MSWSGCDAQAVANALTFAEVFLILDNEVDLHAPKDYLS